MVHNCSQARFNPSIDLKFSFHKQWEESRNRAEQKALLKTESSSDVCETRRLIRIAAANVAVGQRVYTQGEAAPLLDMDCFTGSTSQAGLTREMLFNGRAGDLRRQVCYCPTQTTVNNLRWQCYVIQKEKKGNTLPPFHFFLSGPQ